MKGAPGRKWIEGVFNNIGAKGDDALNNMGK